MAQMPIRTVSSAFPCLDLIYDYVGLLIGYSRSGRLNASGAIWSMFMPIDCIFHGQLKAFIRLPNVPDDA